MAHRTFDNDSGIGITVPWANGTVSDVLTCVEVGLYFAAKISENYFINYNNL